MLKILHILTLGLTVAISLSASSDASLRERAMAANLKPIPKSQLEVLKLIDLASNPITKEKVALGKKLYFDPRLSKSSLISCNTCHNLALGGVDGVAAAIGHKWRANPHHLNSPTVYNSVFNSAQFWDGRSPNLEDQAQGPIQAAPEMAAPKELVVKRITSIPAYVQEFAKAYGDNEKITFKKIADTIAVFERTLVTPSRYDDFLNGDNNALDKAEKVGLSMFIDKACVACHDGVAMGGKMQAFEVVKKYKFSAVGDFKGDKNGMVKAPTLRNIQETAPYFHNGKIWNLKEAIQEMGRIQLGLKINDKEAKSIELFLNSLTGRKPEVVYPILSPSTLNTPKPSSL
jgi:cytochrome c peroxidase